MFFKKGFKKMRFFCFYVKSTKAKTLLIKSFRISKIDEMVMLMLNVV